MVFLKKYLKTVLTMRNALIKERLLQLDIQPVRHDGDSYMFTVNDNLAMNELIEEFGQKTVHDVIKELNLLKVVEDVLDDPEMEINGVGLRRGFVQIIGRQTHREFRHNPENLTNYGVHHFTAQEIADQAVSRNAGLNLVVDIDICSAYLTPIFPYGVPRLQKDSYNPKYSITANGGRREVVMGKAGNHYPIPKKRW